MEQTRPEVIASFRLSFKHFQCVSFVARKDRKEADPGIPVTTKIGIFQKNSLEVFQDCKRNP